MPEPDVRKGERNEELVRLREEESWGWKRLATRFGLSVSRVREIWREEGVRTRKLEEEERRS